MKQRAVSMLTGVAPVLLAGCFGKSHDVNNSQVVATVNGQEITVSQLDQVLRPDGPGAVLPDAQKHAVDSLVSEELLVQGALKHRLDRDPAVVQAIDAARRQVLAHYFAARDLYPKQAATRNEIEDFYTSNPILFESRKRFQLKDFLISSIDLTDRLQSQLDQIHSAAEVRELLEKHNINYTVQSSALTADQLPVDKLAAFARANVGDLMIADQNDGKTLLMFISSIEDDNPLSFERAKPFIELYLANVRDGHAVADYLKQATAVSKIIYFKSAGVSAGNSPTNAPVHAKGDAAYIVGAKPNDGNL